MKKIILNLGVVALTTVLFSACNEDAQQSGNGNNQTPNTSTAQVFVADLAPLNRAYTISEKQSGTAVVTLDGDKIDVIVGGANVDPSMVHMGHIHKGSRCPDQNLDDRNGDGIIDVMEGFPAYGPILVDFGADISSLAAAQNGGDPMTDAKGILSYHGTGSYSSMLKDLRTRPSLPANTGVGDLDTNEAFDLANTVIVIHGIDKATPVPNTLQTLMGQSVRETLPILCGRLQHKGSITVTNPTPTPVAMPTATPVALPSATPVLNITPAPTPRNS